MGKKGKGKVTLKLSREISRLNVALKTNVKEIFSSTLMIEAEISETVFCSTLAWLIAREDFGAFIRREISNLQFIPCLIVMAWRRM
jgi:hypothetical protein